MKNQVFNRWLDFPSQMKLLLYIAGVSGRTTWEVPWTMEPITSYFTEGPSSYASKPSIEANMSCYLLRHLETLKFSVTHVVSNILKIANHKYLQGRKKPYTVTWVCLSQTGMGASCRCWTWAEVGLWTQTGSYFGKTNLPTDKLCWKISIPMPKMALRSHL